MVSGTPHESKTQHIRPGKHRSHQLTVSPTRNPRPARQSFGIATSHYRCKFYSVPMRRTIGMSQTETLLRVTIALYYGARICQLFADRLPLLLTVILHVVPPALFAVLHGRAAYGSKRFAVFALSCLSIGALCESLSLRTGIPYIWKIAARVPPVTNLLPISIRPLQCVCSRKPSYPISHNGPWCRYRRHGKSLAHASHPAG